MIRFIELLFLANSTAIGKYSMLAAIIRGSISCKIRVNSLIDKLVCSGTIIALICTQARLIAI